MLLGTGPCSARRYALADGHSISPTPYYPDLDDTAVVVMAMDRAQRTVGDARYQPAIERGREWVSDLQSRNGGWGAFDADNNYLYLNNIPFSDHGALLDPPTEDVTGRCVSMLSAARRRARRQRGVAGRYRLSLPARNARTAAGTADGA